MQAEIDTNTIIDDTLDWWENYTSSLFVVDKTDGDITVGSIWIASLVFSVIPAKDSTNKGQIVLVDPSSGASGLLFDLANEVHLAELRIYKPLPIGFKLILRQD